MFLHIGSDCVIPMKYIIGIFDLENTTVSKDTKSFLKVAEEEGFVEIINSEIPKSYIIAELDKQIKVFLSPISTATLKKRTLIFNEF